MISALGLALGDLADRRVLGVLLRSLIATLLIFAGVTALLAWALDGVDPCAILDTASCPLGPSEGVVGGVLLGLLAVWLLFPAVAIGVLSAYADRIVGAVEQRHYPAQAATARPLGLSGNAALGLRSSARLLLLNLPALPFYLLLLVTGIGPAILFVAVNGLALGRDLGEMVSLRHLDRTGRRIWYRESRAARLLLGMAVTGLFLVPGVNLLAPVLGAAAATHLFHRRRRLA